MKFKGPLKYAYYALFTIVAAIILLSAFLVVGAHKAHAQSGSSLWKLSGLNLSPVNSTWNLKIPGLNSTGSTRCVNVDSTGLLGVAAADCGTGGGGSSIILDLADNGANESTALAEIATSGDTNSIFSEPSADKLLINLGLDWPKADVADTITAVSSGGDTTSFFAIFDSETGNLAIKTDSNLKWNATSNILEIDGPAQIGGNARPVTNDGGALGTSSFSWSDLFLALGSVINWNAGDLTLTHSADTLTLAGGTLVLPASGLQIGSSNPFSDSAGTLTFQNVDAIDATTETTFEGALDISGDVTGTGLGSVVVAANAVALTTDTTGNYVSSATASGGLTMTGTEGASLGILLPSATDALSATTSSGSGLQLLSSGLTLLQGCSDGQILKWTEATDLWGCAADGGGAGATAYDDIGDPDADSTIAFNGFTNTWSSFLNGGDIFNIESSVGDFTSDTTGLQITFRDNGDANGIFIDLVDDASISPNSVFSIGADGVINSDSGGTFASTISTPTLDLTSTGTINGLDAVDATTESTIESIIDTLANLTSIQGQAMSFAAPLTIPADPNADRFLFWDDSAGATAWLTPGNGVTITTTTVAIDSASDTVDGIVELATTAETNTGTDATRAVTPDGLAGSVHGVKNLDFYILDAAYLVTTGDGKAYSRIPSEYNGMNIVGVSCGVHTTSSSGTPTIQLARGRQSSATSAHTYVDVLSTRVTIDASEYDSKDATTAAVINTANDDMATGDMLRWDVDVTGTGTKGLNCNVGLQLP